MLYDSVTIFVVHVVYLVLGQDFIWSLVHVNSQRKAVSSEVEVSDRGSCCTRKKMESGGGPYEHFRPAQCAAQKASPDEVAEEGGGGVSSPALDHAGRSRRGAGEIFKKKRT
jgi:hypothetical protein